MTPVTVPDGLWQGDEKAGSIVNWLYHDGARVEQGDVIAELMVEKTTYEIEATASGILHIAIEPEIPVAIGETLATIA